ncbi:hypothetical protein AX16_000804 [Volvariella volvacea WC 439]|nr:hypothetical protein AX16_000804 [Volvariella volvacea WC 439]
MDRPSSKRRPRNSAPLKPKNVHPPPRILLLLSVAVGGAVLAIGWDRVHRRERPSVASLRFPSQAVLVDPKLFAVLPSSDTESFRNNSFTEFFNPSELAPPFFQVFDGEFLSILGPDATINEIASNASYAFAHEAPVYVPDIDEVFFSSNNGGPLGMSDLYNNNKVAKISLQAIETALATTTKIGQAVNVPVTELDLNESVQMTNGGTGPYLGDLLLITSGRGLLPPSVVLVNPRPPYNTTVLLNNYYGRQFNSLNDLKIHPTGMIFFTDVVYGPLQDFRPKPLLPNQVYRFDPSAGTVRVVATDFDKCNGIAFTADGKTAYIADTGAANGFLPIDQTKPATIYAFDVDERTHVFVNRRVFAYVDAGVPDGLQVDTKGNVYAGCGDGVHVWNKKGTLLGKFFLGMTTANLVFAGEGRLVILAETKIFITHIAAEGIPLSYK